ncbi:MAG: FtsX-like permease family protein [Patescibacteria group bacterium]|jgi:ABC-type antimicrobial peptide transport system permease subunit
MRLIDVFRLATRNFRTNRLRTFLTILAVSVATSAILFLVSFGYGLQILTVQQIANSATISTVDVTTSSSSSIIKLDDDAVTKIKALPNVVEVASEMDLEAKINLTSLGTTVVHAVSPTYFTLGDIRADFGNVLGDKSDHQAVVSDAFLSQFNLPVDQASLGKTFTLSYSIVDPNQPTAKTQDFPDDKKYTVAGIIKDPDFSSFVYVTMTDAKALVKTVPYANLKAQASDRNNVIGVKDAIGGLGYVASAPLETLEQLNQVFAVVQATLATLGLIALIISSIGMFNTMTVSLLERTKEIGIMKALGADKSDIWKMFIAESSIIGFCGGLAGVLLGLLLTFGANSILNVLARVYGGQQANIFYSPPWFIFAIILFSTVVGAVTGFYPAKRAAGLNPLKALRYE